MPERLKAYRLRCYPKRGQRHALARHFGAARWVWNQALRVRSEAYRDSELTAMFGRGLSISGAAAVRFAHRGQDRPLVSQLEVLQRLRPH